MAYILSHHQVFPYAPNGSIAAYVWSTGTAAYMYSDSAGASSYTEIELDSSGSPIDGNARIAIFVDTSVVYKLSIKSENGANLRVLGPYYPLSEGATGVVDSVASLYGGNFSSLSYMETQAFTAGGSVGGAKWYKNGSGGTQTTNFHTDMQANGYLTDAGLNHWYLSKDQLISLDKFGGAGDGITDDTTAVTTAVSYLSFGESLLIPPGWSVLLSSQITISTASITIYAFEGYLSTKFLTTGSSFIMFKCTNTGVIFRNLEMLGDGSLSLFGQSATTTAIEFNNTSTGDCDSLVDNCILIGHSECISHYGANLEIKGGTISSSIKGVVCKYFATKETRDIRVHEVRFHSLGASSAHASLTDSVCIEIEDDTAYEVHVHDNFADNIKRFFVGNGTATKVDNNFIVRTYEDVIRITNPSVPSLYRWTVNNNFIQGISGSPSVSNGILVDGDAGVIQGGSIVGNHMNALVENGIQLNTVSNLHIADNHIINPQSSGSADTFSGIDCTDVDSCVFVNNTVRKISANNIIAGINLDASSTGNSLVNNTIAGNVSEDILTANSNNIVIDNDTSGLNIYKPGAASVQIDLEGNNSASERYGYGRIATAISSSTDGSEKGRIEVSGSNAGTYATGLVVEEDGKAIVGAKTSQITTSYMPNGSISFHLVEGSNQLQITVKESSGSVYTLTSPLAYS